MLMTPVRPTDKFFKALQSLGDGWHTRAEIARTVRKPRITGYDAALLDVLVSEGKIEAERRQMPGPIGYQWVYRIK